MARVDFLMEASTGKFFINEINTIPGFTSISMYPKMWEEAGMPYAEADRPADRARVGTPRDRASDALHTVFEVCHVLTLLFFSSPTPPSHRMAWRTQEAFTDVFVIVDRRSRGPGAPDSAFYQGAIPGMLRTLDPHSIFFDPGQYDQLKSMDQ